MRKRQSHVMRTVMEAITQSQKPASTSWRAESRLRVGLGWLKRAIHVFGSSKMLAVPIAA